jgi:hypothetical protein
MKITLLFLLLGCIIGVLSYAQSYDPRIQKAIRAQKKAMDAQIIANKAERAKTKSMGIKEKNPRPYFTDAEKAAKNKENMDRIRRRMQFLDNHVGTANTEAKYKAGPGGAAERIGSPGYKSPTNNLVRKEARVAQTYPKRN